MYKKFIFIAFICSALFSACSSKKNNAAPNEERLSKLGVSIKLPENFTALPQEFLEEIQTMGATVLDVDPFIVNPLYSYADNSGKGVIVVSELKFKDGITPEKFALNNLYNYKNNLENYFKSGEITSEEMGNADINTILLAMVFQEEEDIFLFKGLNFVYPNLFFMIDLYVIDMEISHDEAVGYIALFNTLNVY